MMNLADLRDEPAEATVVFDACENLGALNLRGTGFATRDMEVRELSARVGGVDRSAEVNVSGLAGFLLAKAAAAGVLAALPRDPDNPWVIAGRKPGAHLTDLQHPWRRIRARAGLGDVRIHDLRHSFASRALALGESLPMIGKLLGHTQVQTTARYAHLARDSVKASASKIADSIGVDILAGESGQNAA